jgi:type I restriction enzyme S subunit
LRNFDRIGEAPDSIPALRRLVLKVAFSRRLTHSERVPDQTRPLGQLAEFVMGQAPPGPDCNTRGEGTVFVKVGEFGPVYPEIRVWTTRPLKMARTGDVLICVVGATVGKLNLAIDCAIGRSVAAIRPRSGLDSRYLYLALMPFTLELREGARGSAQGVIGRPDLAAIPIWFPPLPEQHRIVSKADSLMSLCDQLEAAQRERELQRDALRSVSLQRLIASEDGDRTTDVRFFLDSSPRLITKPEHVAAVRETIVEMAVLGRLLTCGPENDLDSEFLPSLAAHEPESLGADTPGNWTRTRLGDAIHLLSGQHLLPSEYSTYQPGGLPYITGPADFGGDGLVITRQALVRKAVARKGQVLLTVKGAGVGKTAMCDLPEVAISRQLMALTPVGWSARFLMLTTSRLAIQLKQNARSLIPGISREDVERFPLSLPPLEEQLRIVAKVDELMAVCDKLEAVLGEAQTERGRLLQTLLHESLD